MPEEAKGGKSAIMQRGSPVWAKRSVVKSPKKRAEDCPAKSACLHRKQFGLCLDTRDGPSYTQAAVGGPPSAVSIEIGL